MNGGGTVEEYVRWRAARVLFEWGRIGRGTPSILKAGKSARRDESNELR